MEEKKPGGGGSTRDEKKHQENTSNYFRKHRQKLLLDRRGKPYSEYIYEITPIQDLDIIQQKFGILEKNNVYVDGKNYLQRTQEMVDWYFKDSTEKLVDKEVRKLHVVPDEHNLFETFFLMKIVAVEKYIIPLILDFHYENYLNPYPNTKNSKKNKKKFLGFLEFHLLQYLHSNSPFDYIEKGFTIVNWLREKRKKLRTQWPIIDESVKVDSKGGQDLFSLQEDIVHKFVEKFTTFEANLIQSGFVVKDEDGNLKWSKPIRESVAVIYIMNEKRYFKKDIFDDNEKRLKKRMKEAFEKRYNMSFGQSLERAKFKAIDFSKYQKQKPFSLI